MAEVAIGDVCFREFFIKAPVSSPLLCLGRLYRAGWEVRRREQDLVLGCGDHVILRRRITRDIVEAKFIRRENVVMRNGDHTLNGFRDPAKAHRGFPASPRPHQTPEVASFDLYARPM